MHRTAGDGYITVSGKNYYADEDPPTRAATQLRHQEMNAIQEEIANVVESTGQALNPTTETYAQMNQLNTAIDSKITAAVASEAGLRNAGDVAEAGARVAADNALQTQISALRYPWQYINGFRYEISRGTGKIRNILVYPGFALDENDSSKVLDFSAPGSFDKEVLDTNGALKAFAAGSGNGACDPGIPSYFRSFTGDVTLPQLIPGISDIADTSKILEGDFLQSNWVGSRYQVMQVISKTGSSVGVNTAFTASCNNEVFHLTGRWLYVLALGKSSDPSAHDIGISHQKNNTYFATLGWDLYRRIGCIPLYTVHPGNYDIPLLQSTDGWIYPNWFGSDSLGFRGSHILMGSGYYQVQGVQSENILRPLFVPYGLDLRVRLNYHWSLAAGKEIHHILYSDYFGTTDIGFLYSSGGMERFHKNEDTNKAWGNLQFELPTRNGMFGSLIENVADATTFYWGINVEAIYDYRGQV